MESVSAYPARHPSGHCHARPSARVSSTGLETQGREAVPLRSFFSTAHNRARAPLALITVAFQLGWLFFEPYEEKLPLGREFGPPFFPRGRVIFFVSQRPASEMGTRNSASHPRVCRKNTDG